MGNKTCLKPPTSHGFTMCFSCCTRHFLWFNHPNHPSMVGMDLALAISLACPSARITCRNFHQPYLWWNLRGFNKSSFQSDSITPKSSTLIVGIFHERNLPAIGVPPWLRNPPGPPGFSVTTFNHQTSIQVIGKFEWDMVLGQTNFRKQKHILCSAGCKFQWHMCSSLRHDRCTCSCPNWSNATILMPTLYW